MAKATRLLIKNGTLIDGSGGDPVPNRLLVVEGNRITIVGGVAGISRLGIDEVGDNDIAEPLLLLAGEQPTENWVRVEARKAPPDDAPRAIDQHRDPGGQSARRLCHGVRLPTVARGERTRPRPEEVRFARDSPVEGDGFELSVPRRAIRPFGRGEDVFQ
jgi:hypothetical protein